MDFISNLSGSLKPNAGISYAGLHFQLGETYPSEINIPISTKFGKVVGQDATNPGVVGAYDATASTMSEYCTALNGIVNAEYGDASGELNVDWLIDSGESSLI